MEITVQGNEVVIKIPEDIFIWSTLSEEKKQLSIPVDNLSDVEAQVKKVLKALGL